MRLVFTTILCCLFSYFIYCEPGEHKYNAHVTKSLRKLHRLSGVFSIDKPLSIRENVFPRRQGGPGPRGRHNMTISKKKIPKRDETYYEPYWDKGEWVFLRTTAKPIYKYLTDQGTSFVPFVTEGGTGSDMDVHRECNIPCTKLYYKYYGPVCGQSFNSKYWFYSFKEFNNVCELEYHNCKYERHKFAYRVIHRGSCPEIGSFRDFQFNEYKIVEETDEILKNKPPRKLPLPIG